MMRLGSAIVLAISLWAPAVFAQGSRVVVETASADVRMGPSVVNPVIGRAPRGAVLEVTRHVGDWYKVVWPEAGDRVGYVRRSELAPAASRMRASSVAGEGGAAAPGRNASRSPEQAAVLADLAIDRQPIAVRGAPAMSAPSHVFAGGAMVGGSAGTSAPGLGITARFWPRANVGLQVALERQTMTNTASAMRLTSTAIAPGVLYALPEHLGDFVWVRPYVGAGVQVVRARLSADAAGVRAADRAFGMHAFGGGELTMAAAPRLAVSVDVRFERTPASFDGFEPGGIGLLVGANWYFR